MFWMALRSDLPIRPSSITPSRGTASLFLGFIRRLLFLFFFLKVVSCGGAVVLSSIDTVPGTVGCSVFSSLEPGTKLQQMRQMLSMLLSRPRVPLEARTAFLRLITSLIFF
jgi:hypothetical protein